ncbi:hypothetical protein G6F32_014564 [Rhizopus arrhizus]|nr:hypothetical protein G6F32_014564 [Rhizopus arrhizus]
MWAPPAIPRPKSPWWCTNTCGRTRAACGCGPPRCSLANWPMVRRASRRCIRRSKYGDVLQPAASRQRRDVSHDRQPRASLGCAGFGLAGATRPVHRGRLGNHRPVHRHVRNPGVRGCPGRSVRHAGPRIYTSGSHEVARAVFHHAADRHYPGGNRPPWRAGGAGDFVLPGIRGGPAGIFPQCVVRPALSGRSG